MRLRPVAAGVALAALLAGTASAARIVGTNRADVLRGGSRADIIDGRAGNDLLDGGAGRDRLRGGTGSDSVVAWDGVRDRVSCGPGADVVNADGVDSISPDCETVMRQIASDPYTNVQSQHRTIVEPDSFAYGATVVATFQVGRTVGGGATNIGFSTSLDGGRTWRSGNLSGLTTFAGGRFARGSDPVVAYDARHAVWLITSLLVGGPGGESALVVSRSSNGLSWSGPVFVSRDSQFVFDKQWLACDNGESSPFRGRCYMAYSDLRGEQLAFQSSSDGGLTWSAPVHAPENAGRGGILGPSGAPAPQLLTRPDGTLVVPYFDETRLAAVRSTDGGATFSRPATIAPARFARTAFRTPPLPSADSDANGALYVVWPDCSQRPGCGGDDLLLIRSTDGLSWSAPARIPLGGRTGAVSHVLPGLAAGPNGRLALAFYTATGERARTAFVSSPDGGATWSRVRRLSAETMLSSWLPNTTLGPMFADYISTSFVGQVAVPVLTLARRPDRRLNEAAFAARLNLP